MLGSHRRSRVVADQLFAPRGPGKVVLSVLLAVGALITILPFYTMIVLSVTPSRAIEFPRAMLPWPLTFDPFGAVLGNPTFLRWLFNTAVYAVVSVVGVLLLASMAGYAFARKRFPGREVMFWSFLSMLMVPYHITLIPLFILVRNMDGVSTYWGLIVPTLANAQAVFLLRQFIKTLPDELFDAATVDGASELRIYVSVVLPLLKPILVTLGVFVFLWHWNDFLWPLVIAQDPQMRTLTTGIAVSASENPALNEMLAGAAIALLPIFVIYVFSVRHLTQNFAMSGFKG